MGVKRVGMGTEGGEGGGDEREGVEDEGANVWN